MDRNKKEIEALIKEFNVELSLYNLFLTHAQIEDLQHEDNKQQKCNISIERSSVTKEVGDLIYKSLFLLI